MNVDRDEPRASARAALTPLAEALRARLHDSPSRTPLPDELEQDVRQVRADENLQARFTQAATDAGFVVHATSAANWMSAVVGALRKHEVRSVVVNVQAASPLAGQTPDLRKNLAAAGLTPLAETDDETMFSADAAVTGVAAAIAESGSLVCNSGPDSARGASLIPPIHVAVVHASQLVPDLLDCFSALSPDADLPANINIITGPSKTSDIEGILVTGVHGPRHVHVVLVSP